MPVERVKRPDDIVKVDCHSIVAVGPETAIHAFLSGRPSGPPIEPGRYWCWPGGYDLWMEPPRIVTRAGVAVFESGTDGYLVIVAPRITPSPPDDFDGPVLDAQQWEWVDMDSREDHPAPELFVPQDAEQTIPEEEP